MLFLNLNTILVICDNDSAADFFTTVLKDYSLVDNKSLSSYPWLKDVDLSSYKTVSVDIKNGTDIKKLLESSDRFGIQNKNIIYIFFLEPHTKEEEIRLEFVSSLFENINEGIAIANKDGLIRLVNGAFSKITGYSEDEVVGKNPKILKSGVHDKSFYRHMWDKIESEGYWKGEIYDRRKNGEIYPQILSISKNISSKYQEDCYISVFTDISNLKEADRSIYYHANYDSLTKLPNRTYFNKELQSILEEARENNFVTALFFIDIDKFKEINDTYGHDIGDKMLLTVGKRVLNSIREDDFIARIGGDEFVLIAKNIKNEDNIKKLALHLQKKIKEPMELESHIFHVTLSIGIAVFPYHGSSSKDLLKNADIAMYEVKKSTRDGFKIYDSAMSKKIAMHMSIQNEIKKALQEDEFTFRYQPVIDMMTGSVIGAEALVRWEHPVKGVLEPEEFLEFIISADLDQEFECRVLSKVLKDLNHIDKALPNNGLQISINISKNQLSSLTFCPDFLSTLQRYAINPSRIELEIVETEVIRGNIEIFKKNIAKLSSVGFGMAFDNFGTGYSSLSYLRDIKVDKLKIDRSFIENMMKNKNDLNIIKSIISIARLFELKVQAGGVQTKKQYLKLKDIGCDFSQGFYHSAALDADDFISYFKNIR